MLPLRPDEFLERLLAAHGAEDAFERPEEAPAAPATTTADPATSVDPTSVLGLLTEAERLCGIDDVRLRAAAAA